MEHSCGAIQLLSKLELHFVELEIIILTKYIYFLIIGYCIESIGLTFLSLNQPTWLIQSIDRDVRELCHNAVSSCIYCFNVLILLITKVKRTKDNTFLSKKDSIGKVYGMTMILEFAILAQRYTFNSQILRP